MQLACVLQRLWRSALTKQRAYRGVDFTDIRFTEFNVLIESHVSHMGSGTERKFELVVLDFERLFVSCLISH